MNRKTVFRNLAIVAIIVLAIWGWTVLRDNNRDYKSVDTSVAMTQLNTKNVSEVQMDDREQTLRMTLKDPAQAGGDKKISAKYPARTTEEVFDRVDASGAKYQTNVNQESFLMQMLIFILPLVLLFGLFFFVMNRMQGGGKGGVMGFGAAHETWGSSDYGQRNDEFRALDVGDARKVSSRSISGSYSLPGAGGLDLGG